MEIKANELRIGNLVYYNGTHKEVGEVSSIMAHITGDQTIGLNKRVNMTFLIEELQPIQLTEKILLKCKGTLDGYIYNGWDDMKFFRFDEYSANIFELEICSDGFYYGCNKIEFLHDLQNCYYFHENIKKELTVNL